VALAPEVIFASGSAAAGPLRRATPTVPIVFTSVPDPVGAGFVESLARPGGNMTGFTPFEYGIGAKWLELLKEIAPTKPPAQGRTHIVSPATSMGGFSIGAP
jgi:putative ABC transport system substrate-binding protein